MNSDRMTTNKDFAQGRDLEIEYPYKDNKPQWVLKQWIKPAIIDSPSIVIANYCIGSGIVPRDDPARGIYWRGVMCDGGFT